MILNDAFEAIHDSETRGSILALVMSLSAEAAVRVSRG